MKPTRLSRKEFAHGLRAQLAQGYDPIRIAQWAYELHLDARELEEGLESDLMTLMVMDMGTEYELSEDEICKLAERE